MRTRSSVFRLMRNYRHKLHNCRASRFFCRQSTAPSHRLTPSSRTPLSCIYALTSLKTYDAVITLLYCRLPRFSSCACQLVFCVSEAKVLSVRHTSLAKFKCTPMPYCCLTFVGHISGMFRCTPMPYYCLTFAVSGVFVCCHPQKATVPDTLKARIRPKSLCAFLCNNSLRNTTQV